MNKVKDFVLSARSQRALDYRYTPCALPIPSQVIHKPFICKFSVTIYTEGIDNWTNGDSYSGANW